MRHRVRPAANKVGSRWEATIGVVVPWQWHRRATWTFDREQEFLVHIRQTGQRNGCRKDHPHFRVAAVDRCDYRLVPVIATELASIERPQGIGGPQSVLRYRAIVPEISLEPLRDSAPLR